MFYSQQSGGIRQLPAHIAHWTIAHNCLYLDGLAAYPPRETETGIEELLDLQLPVMAEWFEGSLRLGAGQELAPSLYFREFSEYLILDIVAGRVVQVSRKPGTKSIPVEIPAFLLRK